MSIEMAKYVKASILEQREALRFSEDHPLPDDQRCIYRVVRGQRKGQRCNYPKHLGSPLCIECFDKRTAIDQAEQYLHRGTQ